MKPVEEAANRITGVKIYDIAGREKVAKYAVLTSVLVPVFKGKEGEALIVLSGEMLDTIYKSGEFQRILRER